MEAGGVRKFIPNLKNNISFCSHSYSGLPDYFIKTAPTAYYRLHGVPDLYYSAYSNEKLRQIADVGLKKKSAKQIYCVFNNKAAVGATKIRYS